MKLDTSNLDHLRMIQEAAKKNHTVTATADDGSHLRIGLVKDAPSELDSIITAEEIFDVIGPSGKASIGEFEHLIVSDKSL